MTGNVVATTVIDDPNVPDWKLLVPSSPLVAGAYTVDYNEPCPAPATLISRAFTVTDDVAPPTTLGSLRGDSAVTGKVSVGNWGGSCSAEIRALSFDLVLDKDSTVADLLPFTRFQIKVDGALALQTNYGEATRNANGEVVAARMVSACDARNKDDDNGPVLGDHLVSVSAHVAGASSDPPSVTAYIRFRCDGGFMNLPMDTDGGLAVPDAGTKTTGDAGGAGDDPSADPAGDSNADSRSNADPGSGCSGCTTSRTPHPSTAFTFLAVGLVGIARSIVRRRRL